MPDKKIEESWERFSVNLKPPIEKSYKGSFAKLGSVAALLFVLLSTYFYMEIYNPIISVSNFSQIDKKVSLPDGSLVFLKKGATIRYKEDFRDSRGVALKGHAFFDVVEDSLREFKVITGATTTKVLGTTFSVNGNEGSEAIEVSLYTGRVLVSVEGKAQSWGIIPGESFVYRKGKVCIKKFNTKLSFETGNKFIDVNNIALEELFDFLGKRFGYEFKENEFTENKQVTLRINKSDSLDRILKVLSIINNVNYEVNQETKEIQVFSK